MTNSTDRAAEAYAAETRRLAERLYRRVCVQQPEIYRTAYAVAAGRAAHKMRNSGKHLLEGIRAKDFCGSDGRDVKVSNDCATVLVRILRAWHPEIAGSFELRASKFDLPGMPWDCEVRR